MPIQGDPDCGQVAVRRPPAAAIAPAQQPQRGGALTGQSAALLGGRDPTTAAVSGAVLDKATESVAWGSVKALFR